MSSTLDRESVLKLLGDEVLGALGPERQAAVFAGVGESEMELRARDDLSLASTRLLLACARLDPRKRARLFEAGLPRFGAVLLEGSEKSGGVPLWWRSIANHLEPDIVMSCLRTVESACVGERATTKDGKTAACGPWAPVLALLGGVKDPVPLLARSSPALIEAWLTGLSVAELSRLARELSDNALDSLLSAVHPLASMHCDAVEDSILSRFLPALIRARRAGPIASWTVRESHYGPVANVLSGLAVTQRLRLLSSMPGAAAGRILSALPRATRREVLASLEEKAPRWTASILTGTGDGCLPQPGEPIVSLSSELERHFSSHPDALDAVSPKLLPAVLERLSPETLENLAAAHAGQRQTILMLLSATPPEALDPRAGTTGIAGRFVPTLRRLARVHSSLDLRKAWESVANPDAAGMLLSLSRALWDAEDARELAGEGVDLKVTQHAYVIASSKRVFTWERRPVRCLPPDISIPFARDSFDPELAHLLAKGGPVEACLRPMREPYRSLLLRLCVLWRQELVGKDAAAVLGPVQEELRVLEATLDHPGLDPERVARFLAHGSAASARLTVSLLATLLSPASRANAASLERVWPEVAAVLDQRVAIAAARGDRVSKLLAVLLSVLREPAVPEAWTEDARIAWSISPSLALSLAPPGELERTAAIFWLLSCWTPARTTRPRLPATAPVPAAAEFELLEAARFDLPSAVAVGRAAPTAPEPSVAWLRSVYDALADALGSPADDLQLPRHSFGALPMASVLNLVASGVVALIGSPGFGKTTAAELAGEIGLGIPIEVSQGATLSGNPGLTEESLAHFALGPLVKEGAEILHASAFVFSPIRIIDELNRIPPQLLAYLLGLLGRNTLQYRGHSVPTAESPVMFITMNPNERSGTWDLPLAIRDRLDLAVTVHGSHIDARSLLARLGHGRGASGLVTAETFASNATLRASSIAFRQIRARVAGEVIYPPAVLATIDHLFDLLSYCDKLGGDSAPPSRRHRASADDVAFPDLCTRTHCVLFGRAGNLCHQVAAPPSTRARDALLRYSGALAWFLRAGAPGKPVRVTVDELRAIWPLVAFHRIAPMSHITEDVLPRRHHFLNGLFESALASIQASHKVIETVEAVLAQDPSKVSGSAFDAAWKAAAGVASVARYGLLMRLGRHRRERPSAGDAGES